MQVASMPHGLIATQQEPLISHSTHSAKLLAILPGVTAVIMTIARSHRGIRRMHETKQTPPPMHFCVKVVCQGGAYFRKLTIIYNHDDTGTYLYVY